MPPCLTSSRVTAAEALPTWWQDPVPLALLMVALRSPPPSAVRVSPEGKGMLGRLREAHPAHSFQWKRHYHTCSSPGWSHLRAGALRPPASGSSSAGLGSSTSSGIPLRRACPANFTHPFCQSAQVTVSLHSSLQNLAMFWLKWPELSPR